MKNIIKRTPIIGALVQKLYQQRFIQQLLFSNSEDYWIGRYRRGGNSGVGSYGKFADFKAEIINQFVDEQQIETVIEYGCGDGNQLQLARYPTYLGFDVSATAIAICKREFAHDQTKEFRLMKEYRDEQAQLTLSLDVIYHLIEDPVFADYMHRLFDSSQAFVIIYSSNYSDTHEPIAMHVRHRKFTDWVEEHKPDWRLKQHIPNRYPYANDPETGSFADFYIYQRNQ